MKVLEGRSVPFADAILSVMSERAVRNERYLVTSALPYANGPLHIGHMAGAYLPADVYVRYLRMQGEDVVFVGGTDEHGVPITLTAEHRGSQILISVADDGPLRAAPAKVDVPRIERAVREILLAVGEDPDREGLRDTPARVARALHRPFVAMNDEIAAPAGPHCCVPIEFFLVGCGGSLFSFGRRFLRGEA